MPETPQTSSREYATEFSKKFNIDQSVINQKAFFEWAVQVQQENERMKAHIELLDQQLASLHESFHHLALKAEEALEKFNEKIK